MPATKAAIDLTKLSVGKAHVFVGDFSTADALAALGMCEGAITATPESQFSTLTLPEVTGNAPLKVTKMGDTLAVSMSLLVGDPELWAKLSPTAAANAGSTTPVEVTYTSMVIIPEAQLAADGSISYATTAWEPAEPTSALFIPKGYFSHVPREYEHNDTGSKKASAVTFTAVQDLTLPEGFQLWFQGASDAIAAGVTIAI